VEFFLLGPVEVRIKGCDVDAGRPQQRAVLAALLVDAGRPVMPETLLARVWDGEPATGARRALHAHISRIRTLLAAGGALGSAAVNLIRRSGGYLLDMDPGRVDIHRFHELTRRAGANGNTLDEQAQMLRDALDLWRGPPMADLASDWAERTRGVWLRERLDAATRWGELALRLGRYREVMRQAEDLAEGYPLAEQLTALHMQALLALDRRAEALQLYAATRTRLIEELGTEPGPQLRDLHLAILRDHPGPQPATPAQASARQSVKPAQLPTDLHGFAGRTDYLDRLDALLTNARDSPTAVLISAVSGMPGVGKTALAVHWAHRVAGQFPDGQLYVDLRGFHPGGQVTTPGEALRSFLHALGVPAERIPTDHDAQVGLYRSHLANKRLLIVLDNARDADQARSLLPGTPGCLVLITSRSHLTPLVANYGAHSLTLDLLSPAEARDLLGRRLGASRVAAETDAVERIIAACARLPLALAITAARAQHTGLSLATIATELADAAQRLDLLDAGDAASQVRAVFSWSYAALTMPAARLFRLLGLHPGPDLSATATASLGGCPLAEARQLLTELVRANLVTEHVPGRYRLHDLLREYAAELTHTHDQPDTRRAASTRLLDHYTHTAHAADQLISPRRDPIPQPLTRPAEGAQPEHLTDAAAATAWLTAEHQVLLTIARQHTSTEEDRYIWQLAWALDTFLYRQGLWHDQTDAWTAALHAARRLDDKVGQAYAHRLLASIAVRLSQPDEAQQHLDHALDLYSQADDLTGQAHTLHHIAYLWERRGQPENALQPLHQALAHYQTLGHPREPANILNSLGWIHTLTGNPEEALACSSQALAVFEQLGDPAGAAATLDTLGHAHEHLGDQVAAIDCYQRSLAGHTEVGDRSLQANTATRLGDAYLAAGDPDAARAVWRQALDILKDLDPTEAKEVQARLTDLDRS
jgi:DNA-binding SARP family transcriptional activator